MMEKRVAPWIKKKIVEYIGEEEPTLVDFICNKVGIRFCKCVLIDLLRLILKLACHIAPQSILSDISMVSSKYLFLACTSHWCFLLGAG